MKNFAFLLLMFAGMSFAFTACNEDNEDTVDVTTEDLISTEDLTTVEDLLQDAEDEIDQLIEDGLVANGEIEVREDDCPSRTVVPADGTFPRTITIDYGESCTSPRGREKSGQIVIEQSAPMNEAGATRTTTFVEYFVDGVNLQGMGTLVNNGTDENNNPSFTSSHSHTIIYPDGDEATWEGSHTRTQIAGSDTPRIFDDVFTTIGSSSGVNRNGFAYSATILEPIVKANRCPWIVNGIRQVSRNDKTATIDYGFGNEDCDNKAQVTLPDGTTRVIRIEAWWRR